MVDKLREATNELLRKHFSEIKELTEQQFEVISSLFVESKDTFAILSTGHGKTLRFYMAPVLAKELLRLVFHFRARNFVALAPIVDVSKNAYKSKLVYNSNF